MNEVSVKIKLRRSYSLFNVYHNVAWFNMVLKNFSTTLRRSGIERLLYVNI